MGGSSGLWGWAAVQAEIQRPIPHGCYGRPPFPSLLDPDAGLHAAQHRRGPGLGPAAAAAAAAASSPQPEGGPGGPSIPEVAAEDTSQPAAAFAAATATAHAQKQQLAVAFADPVVSAQADRWQRRQQQVASAALQRQQAAGGLLPAPRNSSSSCSCIRNTCCSQALRSLHLQQMQQHLAAAVLLKGNPPEWSPSSFPN